MPCVVPTTAKIPTAGIENSTSLSKRIEKVELQ
ncbi:MAG: hypothetical protein ACI90V_004485 [Bacillariaceae sp.]|jgi:hypothetical protein